MNRAVYVIASSAGVVVHLNELLSELSRRNWDPCVILTPTAASWVDVQALDTRYPVRVQSRLPHEKDPLPKAAAVIAAPLTFNSLNKWAAGISDTLAMGLLNEAVGLDIPVIAAPIVNPTLRRHPAYASSVETLRSIGVTVLDPQQVAIRKDGSTVNADWAQIVTALAAGSAKVT